MTTRIKQAVAKVMRLNGTYFWVRISRQSINNLIRYWRNYPNFKYIKFFEIINYTKGGSHKIGSQLGYITINGFNFK